jgi:hypothetical protein
VDLGFHLSKESFRRERERNLKFEKEIKVNHDNNNNNNKGGNLTKKIIIKEAK